MPIHNNAKYFWEEWSICHNSQISNVVESRFFHKADMDEGAENRIFWAMLEDVYLSVAQTGYSICASLFIMSAHSL